jgi:hypothetical protein
LQGLGEVGRGDRLGFGEVGDGAGELEHAMEGAGGELQALGGGVQQRRTSVRAIAVFDAHALVPS